LNRIKKRKVFGLRSREAGMDKINSEVGKKIRSIRKIKAMTVQELADRIDRSKATVSKYESGAISMDIGTLYAVAKALNVHVEQLLYLEPDRDLALQRQTPSAFFNHATRYYSYFFDGRNNRLVRCVADIMAQTETGGFQTMLYMNVRNYQNYWECENTYRGYTEHYDALTRMSLKNQATPLENISINILASFLDTDRKWGLMSGVSFRPFMPIALKMLFSKKPLNETAELIQELKISKDDVRIMKMYNMLSVT